jgi:hypothetical protein
MDISFNYILKLFILIYLISLIINITYLGMVKTSRLPPSATLLTCIQEALLRISFQTLDYPDWGFPWVPLGERRDCTFK